MNNERETYPAGVPCWVDAVHDDPAAAAAFYRGVLGWDMEDALPPDAGAHYFMARVDGSLVAAIGSAYGPEVGKAFEHAAGIGVGALDVANNNGLHVGVSSAQPSVSVTTRGNSV